jgi:serine/threonine-protein kinase
MGVKCPKCQHENPEDTLYCGKCGEPLKPAEDISTTKTYITPKDSLQKGSTFAGRYTIIEELGQPAQDLCPATLPDIGRMARPGVETAGEN